MSAPRPRALAPAYRFETLYRDPVHGTPMLRLTQKAGGRSMPLRAEDVAKLEAACADYRRRYLPSSHDAPQNSERAS